MLAARRGDRAEAQRIDQALAALSQPYLTGFPTYYRAQIAAVFGDRDRAVELLRDAIAHGAVDPWEHLHAEPAFAGLHGYPPFDELIPAQGLRWQPISELSFRRLWLTAGELAEGCFGASVPFTVLLSVRPIKILQPRGVVSARIFANLCFHPPLFTFRPHARA